MKHTLVIFIPVAFVILEKSPTNGSDPEVISSVVIPLISSRRPIRTVSTSPKINTGIPKNNKELTVLSCCYCDFILSLGHLKLEIEY